MIKNIEKFHKWVKQNSIHPVNNMEEWEEDLLKQIGSTRSNDYEMAARETKSGYPETISFNREIITDKDEEIIEEDIIF